MGVSKFPQLGLSWFWGPITLFADLQLRWDLRKRCSLCWNLFNDMSQDTSTQGNWGDSRLLVVESQIGNLNLGPSFGHNLCFTCPNGSCKSILDICIPRAFQWYKDLFNPMRFVPCNHSLKIWESIVTPTPKVGAHLGVWRFIPSHFPTLSRAWDMIPMLPFWLAPLQALALVVSPRLGLGFQHSPIYCQWKHWPFLLMGTNVVTLTVVWNQFPKWVAKWYPWDGKKVEWTSKLNSSQIKD
jgi:hypothetical protein